MKKLRSGKPRTGAGWDRPSGVISAMTPDLEAELLRRLWNFQSQLADSQDVEKVIARSLRLSLDFFGAREGCVATFRAAKQDAEVSCATPAGSSWDRAMLAHFLRKEDVRVDPGVMLARVRRFDRMWAVLAVRDTKADFRWDARRAFSSVGAVATRLIRRIEDERVRQVRGRIDQKVLEEVAPKNLFYQILHGLRSLIGYDHSAALLTWDESRASLELVGEQIAWRKAKSHQIGLKLRLEKPISELLAKNVVFGFSREQKRWHDWTGHGAEALAELLDYNREGPGSGLPAEEGSVLCAPLVTRREVLGVLKVASVFPGTFGAYEAHVIAQFLPQVAVALQNMRRTESLHQRMRAAERQQAMADFARGVSHDVNNALGSVLPLVQQMQADMVDGVFDAVTAREDLAEVERSLQVCRRIFGGMLSFARRAALNASDVSIHQAIEGTLAVYRELLERSGIQVCVDVPADLPALRGIQADIEQLFLNVIGNAREAMETGGRLTIRAIGHFDRIEISVSDTGCGIPAANLARIPEPFFTTKPTGSGLGLSICQSIVSQMRGRLRIDSQERRGTTVRITLPLPQEAQG